MSITRWLFAAVAVFTAAPALAQTAPSLPEDLEARVIAQRGATLVGVSGSLSRFFSAEDVLPGTYTVQVDAHRFVTSRLAVRLGVLGTGRFAASSSDDEDTGPGAASVEAGAGALYYFTPQSIWSLYAGAEYRARLTRRVDDDTGAAGALAGLQGALSSRASFFLEAGYGVRIARGDEGELLTRITGQVGVRFRF